ncbi:MAG TPA: hydroxymethylglutaryl-CoA reductase, partial [Acidimicrobiales bacterium]|nr:hydroxymethylglutaryl-CoA reductase [Acidimicrobiales bacterium]
MTAQPDQDRPHARPPAAPRFRVPADDADDYAEGPAADRRRFLRRHTGADLRHVGHYSVDPSSLRGNTEHFTGVAQVPIGVAGPLRMLGEHARGDFYVPLAATEGALVASYNRGMRVLAESGGVEATVVESAMQRAPVFVMADARAGREFGRWVEDHLEDIRKAAEETTRTGRLIGIDQHAVGPLRYLRFNYSTGDAAGQNMTSRATYAACRWIEANYPERLRYMLSGNIETDKKHSRINMLETRGRRVVAEATIPNSVFEDLLGVDTATLFWARQIQSAGSFLVGSASNGSHAANGLAALFIATGQDVADVAESHTAVTYTQLLDNGDYYWSVTLPSLIVATVGGGTALA